jgi:hypothetical protein
MLVAAAGMAYLTQLGVSSTYTTVVLPALLLTAIGLGLVFPAATNGATAGLGEDDAGVGSAMVNTTQQIGGSIGIALLNTMATSAAASYLAGKPHTLDVAAHAAVHGYTVAFWCAAGIFALGALLAAFVLRGRTTSPTAAKRPAEGGGSDRERDGAVPGAAAAPPRPAPARFRRGFGSSREGRQESVRKPRVRR